MKALIEFLRTILFRPKVRASGQIKVRLQCDRCGEVLTAQVDLQHDLSVEYGERPSADRYFVHKTVTGSGPCFQRIHVDLEFDAQKQRSGAQVSGGRLISEQEYSSLRDEPEQTEG